MRGIGNYFVYRIPVSSSRIVPARQAKQGLCVGFELLIIVDEVGSPFREERYYPIPRTDAVSVVRFLLEHKGLRQRDLVPEFGSESAVSMFLAGQRKLTLEQVRRLSKRFKLPADVFVRT